MLCLVQRQSLRSGIQLDQLAITGGASTSIFPLVESWLDESSDHRKALGEISVRKSDPGYWSVIDFVLVSVCPSLRRACFAFYAGKGAPLRETVTEAERCYFERRILLFLEIAYAAFSEKRRLSWSAALEVVDQLEVA